MCKQLNQIDLDAVMHPDIDAAKEKQFVLKVCCAQMDDLDFCSLDPDFVDDI